MFILGKQLIMTLDEVHNVLGDIEVDDATNKIHLTDDQIQFLTQFTSEFVYNHHHRRLISTLGGVLVFLIALDVVSLLLIPAGSPPSLAIAILVTIACALSVLALIMDKRLTRWMSKDTQLTVVRVTKDE